MKRILFILGVMLTISAQASDKNYKIWIKSHGILSGKSSNCIVFLTSAFGDNPSDEADLRKEINKCRAGAPLMITSDFDSGSIRAFAESSTVYYCDYTKTIVYDVSKAPYMTCIKE